MRGPRPGAPRYGTHVATHVEQLLGARGAGLRAMAVSRCDPVSVGLTGLWATGPGTSHASRTPGGVGSWMPGRPPTDVARVPRPAKECHASSHGPDGIRTSWTWHGRCVCSTWNISRPACSCRSFPAKGVRDVCGLTARRFPTGSRPPTSPLFRPFSAQALQLDRRLSESRPTGPRGTGSVALTRAGTPQTDVVSRLESHETLPNTARLVHRPRGASRRSRGGHRRGRCAATEDAGLRWCPAGRGCGDRPPHPQGDHRLPTAHHCADQR